MKDKRSYRLELVTPEKTVLNEEIIFVVIKSGAGPVGIMPEHAPLLGTVDTGILTYRDLEKQDRRVNVGPGFFMVSSDGVSIVARSAELVS
ncbi:MAG: F0F1 ATP synthase subunit epsilon [Deltaproteobacteria bacterium]|nr:F0F1 ATP synthase subunit epsilon [Deltaproteobacteria bacterium]